MSLACQVLYMYENVKGAQVVQWFLKRNDEAVFLIYGTGKISSWFLRLVCLTDSTLPPSMTAFLVGLCDFI